MSFDTYNWPAPWEKENNSKLKNKQVKLSDFNTTNRIAVWEEKGVNWKNRKSDLSVFNTDNWSISNKW